MQKKINFKNFYCRSLGHTDHLYTYKLYVEHVGLTEKREKPSKLAILLVKKSNTFIGNLAQCFEP